MRADRLLSILLLLQIHGRLTARELAGRLEISERTVHRDMEALSAAGVPVLAERGNGGGWCLPERYRTDLTGLNQSEIQTLFLGKPGHLLEDLQLSGAFEAALTKLLAALPAVQRQAAEQSRQRIYVDTTGWWQAEENLSWLPVIQEAVWNERRLNLTYTRNDGSVVERLVDPLGLVAKGSSWYLVAAVEGEARSYRVSRVRAASLSGEVGQRPPGFDLEAYWQKSAVEFKASLPAYHAAVRLHSRDLSRLKIGIRYTRIEEVSAPDEQGRVTVNLRFQSEPEACECLLGLGSRVEVLEPPELRARLVAEAAQILAFYAGQLS